MDSDKAIGGLYLDADDFLRTGFLCHSCRRLSGKREESSLLFLQTDNHNRCLPVYETDWLPAYNSPLLTLFPLSLYKFSINAAKREQAISQLGCSMCMKAHGHGCHDV